ncbi:hypothetical protein HBH98_204860 [Parastagonospora nodorum]|nr:hypothetical protein HBI09_191520 [Parastagonospora nodorum]KAH4339476.1 hypothetical protein HBH98_204860 [Parastagonospora nodorum]KAH4362384.1 hypothetical protein HBH97_193160 [Parastagonospora nodorum]KAH4379725.1 hypothetical protein HBH99_200760 [Parastagonospora nodorum]KAH4801263.1 hypothetical protein HBH61_198580 [Parastagonospora nodorum]
MRILSCALDERSNIGSELSIFKCTHSNGSVQLLWCKVQCTAVFGMAGAPCVDGNPRR